MADKTERPDHRMSSVWLRATGRDSERPSSSPSRQAPPVTRKQERKPRRS